MNGVFDKFLIFGSEIFRDFGIKRGIRKLPFNLPLPLIFMELTDLDTGESPEWNLYGSAIQQEE